MQNLNVIFDAIAIPFSAITTLLIISKNKRNIVNILMGVVTFLGGVATVVFGLLKELTFFYNLQLAIFFAKMALLSIYLISIPLLSFSIFFWRSQKKNIPRITHFFAPLLVCFLTLWLFLDPNVVQLEAVYYGTDFFIVFNSVKLPFTITSTIIMLLVILLLIIELQLIARRTRDFPSLRRRMHILTIGFAIGLIGGVSSIFLVQLLKTKVKFQPAVIFVILSSTVISLILLKTISREQHRLWHGCPKLLYEKDGTTYCTNTLDGVPREIKVLDLGDIIEKIQIEVDVLKTGEENCANVLFSDEQGNVCCLTTHKYIEVLGEVVNCEEMELAQSMEIMENNKLCSDCLYKIIAYRKQHKEKSSAEIRSFFLGIRAEEFFGLS